MTKKKHILDQTFFIKRMFDRNITLKQFYETKNMFIFFFFSQKISVPFETGTAF